MFSDLGHPDQGAATTMPTLHGSRRDLARALDLHAEADRLSVRSAGHATRRVVRACRAAVYLAEHRRYDNVPVARHGFTRPGHLARAA